jgi:hypothetical protein
MRNLNSAKIFAAVVGRWTKPRRNGPGYSCYRQRHQRAIFDQLQGHKLVAARIQEWIAGQRGDAVLRNGFGCGSIAIGAGPQDMNPQT